MFYAKPTRYGAGATLYGDYFDLKNLHNTIHHLSEAIPNTEAMRTFLHALAYDVRHAYQGDREILETDVEGMENTTYGGVRVLWPILIPQVGLLRWSAAFTSTTKSHQADLFRLEHAVETALVEQDGKVGSKCIELFTLFSGGLPQDYLFNFISDCSERYISTSSGKARFTGLPRVLRMLMPITREYQQYRARIEAFAADKGCLPSQVETDYHPVDFRW